MELLVGKVMAKFLHFRNLSKTLLRVYVSKSSSSGNFEKFPLINGVAGLGHNTARSKLLTKFPKTVLKISENSREELR